HPRSPTGLNDYDGLRLGTLGAVLGFELDLRALGQRLEALAADRAEMHEHVLTAITRSDEPKALRVVEPLHGSGCHTNTSSHPTQERAKEAHDAPTDTRSDTASKLAASSRPTEFSSGRPRLPSRFMSSVMLLIPRRVLRRNPAAT